MKNTIAAAVLIFVFGCEATPYQKLGTNSLGGYADQRFDDDIFYVSFKANSNTSRETVCEYLYRRAAELSLANGYRYFIVIRGAQHLTQTAQAYLDRDRGNDVWLPVTVEIPDSGMRMTIKCFKEKPEPSAAEDREVRIINAKSYLLTRLSPH